MPRTLVKANHEIWTWKVTKMLTHLNIGKSIMKPFGIKVFFSSDVPTISWMIYECHIWCLELLCKWVQCSTIVQSDWYALFASSVQLSCILAVGIFVFPKEKKEGQGTEVQTSISVMFGSCEKDQIREEFLAWNWTALKCLHKLRHPSQQKA